MKTRHLLLLPLLAACTLGTAHATSSASITASNFTFTLTDLAPNDGIAPSLSWLPAQTQPATSGLHITDAISGEQVRLNSSHAAADLPLSLTRSSQNGRTGVQLSGTGLSNLNMGASATFNGAGALDNRAGAWVSSDQYVFTLSPHTSLTISVDLDLRATTTVGSLQPERWESAGSHAYLILEESTSSSWVPSSLETYYIDPQDLRRQDTLFTTLDNLGGTARTVRFRTELSAYAHSVASTVPEPSSWAMLLLGASVLATAGARRRAKSAAPSAGLS